MTQDEGQKAADSALKKALVEDSNSAFDEVDELLERWHERFSIHNLALAERYLKNEIVLVLTWVDLTSSTDAIKPKQFLTVLEGINPLGRLKGQWRKGGGRVRRT